MENTLDLADSVTDIVSFMKQSMGFITGNEILMLFLAAGIVSVALGLFAKAKHTVR